LNWLKKRRERKQKHPLKAKQRKKPPGEVD
jgi:hypothetical protein